MERQSEYIPPWSPMAALARESGREESSSLSITAHRYRLCETRERERSVYLERNIRPVCTVTILVTGSLCKFRYKCSDLKAIAKFKHKFWANLHHKHFQCCTYALTLWLSQLNDVVLQSQIVATVPHGEVCRTRTLRLGQQPV